MAIDKECVRQWLQHPDRGREIADHVASKLNCTLPAEGLLAGQAVASAIADMLGTGLTVYNDADIFADDNNWERLTGESYKVLSERLDLARTRKVSHTAAYQADERLEYDEYEETLAVASRGLYTVRTTRVDGPLNFVLVNWLYPQRGESQTRRLPYLVESFDINSTQAGVDLATGTLAFSEGFLEFLVSDELRITQLYTPMHSLLRYLKKRQELGCYGNDEMHVEMVLRRLRADQGPAALAEIRAETFADGRSCFLRETRHKLAEHFPRHERELPLLGVGLHRGPLSFGRKYQAMAARFSGILDERISLVPSSSGRLWLARAHGEGTDLEARSVGVMGRERAVFGPMAVKTFWGVMLPAGKLTRARRERFDDWSARWNEGGPKDALILARTLMGDSFLEGFDNASNAERLLKLVNEHQEVAGKVAHLPVREQIDVTQKLARGFKAAGLKPIWGLLRALPPREVQRAAEEPHRLRDLIDEHVRSMGVQVDTPLPLPTSIGEVGVCELVSGMQLLEEGQRMSHCVGGYARAVRQGVSRIISLKAGPKATDCATVEWNVREDTSGAYLEVDGKRVYPRVVVLGQNRTFANQEPLPVLWDAERELRAQVNEWLRTHILEGFQMLVPEFRRAMSAEPAWAD